MDSALVEVVEKCFAWLPEDRPDFETIFEDLNRIIETEYKDLRQSKQTCDDVSVEFIEGSHAESNTQIKVV